MARFPIFLSVVIVVRDQSEKLASILKSVGANVAPMVEDYELIVVDNGSSDDSVRALKSLTGAAGLPNLQAYVLTKSVDLDTASWVGLESALGDFVAVFDPESDDIEMLHAMIDAAVSGADVVFACNDSVTTQGIVYGIAFRLFNALYARLQKVDLSREAPRYRIVAKRVINFILQHPQPSRTYRYLPATAGFSKVSLSYSSKPKPIKRVPDCPIISAGRLTSAIVGTCRSFDGQHTEHYLAAFEWCFNRRFDLAKNIERLARVAVVSAPTTSVDRACQTADGDDWAIRKGLSDCARGAKTTLKYCGRMVASDEEMQVT